jgi:alkylhydroperoxidase family enzyme
METRHGDAIERLRAAAEPEREAPPAMRQYLDTVHRHAYRVTDADVAGLLAAGFSQDEVFEQTVSVAVAAGLERLVAGLRVVG